VDTQVPADAAHEVTALYQAHALGLVRLAVIMVGDQGCAEDVVQDAFFGLYRNWDSLANPSSALAYVRSSVLNGCRTLLRRRSHGAGLADASAPDGPSIESAEAWVLLGEEHREVLAAIRRLPDRQREALLLRYYFDMTADQAAQAMGVTRGTVKSATSRAVAAVARMLRENS
jgi:RNA polymerase sigma-70 factor (sigma-E family)